MQNMEAFINSDSVELLNNTAGIKERWNCRNKNNCPVDGKYLTPIYYLQSKRSFQTSPTVKKQFTLERGNKSQTKI